MRLSREPFDVKQLSTSVVDRTEPRECDVIRHRGDDVIFLDDAPIATRDDHEVGGGIVTAEGNLALQTVEVRWEVLVIGKDAPAVALGPVEGGNKGMQVDRRASGYHNLVRVRANQVGLLGSEILAKPEPRPFTMGPAVNPMCLPGLDGGEDCLLGIMAERAERVPVHVDGARVQVEPLTEGA